MLKYIGYVESIETTGTGSKIQSIKLNHGDYCFFWDFLSGYNKSLKIGDRVTVFFTNSLNGKVAERAIKSKLRFIK